MRKIIASFEDIRVIVTRMTTLGLMSTATQRISNSARVLLVSEQQWLSVMDTNVYSNPECTQSQRSYNPHNYLYSLLIQKGYS